MDDRARVALERSLRALQNEAAILAMEARSGYDREGLAHRLDRLAEDLAAAREVLRAVVPAAG